MFGREGVGEFDHVLVEKGHAGLDAVCHRHLVLAYEQVDEMRPHVVLQAVREMVGAALLKQGPALFERRPQIRRGAQLRETRFGMKLRRSNECVDRLVDRRPARSVGRICVGEARVGRRIVRRHLRRSAALWRARELGWLID